MDRLKQEFGEELRYSPLGILHGDLWFTLKVSHDEVRHELRLYFDDITLKCPELGYSLIACVSSGSWITKGRFLADAANLIRQIRRIEEGFLHVPLELRSGDGWSHSSNFEWYKQTKLAQTKDCSRFFALFDTFIGYEMSPSLINFAWVLATERGGEILTVLKNRLAAKELL